MRAASRVRASVKAIARWGVRWVLGMEGRLGDAGLCGVCARSARLVDRG